MHPIVWTAAWTYFLVAAGAAPAGEGWPQFRGRNSSGLAAESDRLPQAIATDAHVAWKVELPPGHSSPVIAGDRIFVTAERGEKLLTLGLDRATGRVAWEAEAPHTSLEEIHRIGSHAQSSPATDGQCVVSFFGSCGLFCYDREGKLLWNRPMGPFNNDFGAGTSPIIVGDRVILCQDHDLDSFLMALDKQTGKTLWKVDRSEFPRNYCSPVIWEVGGRKQIVVAATLRVVGYDLESGRELWTVRGISRAVCMTPVVGEDNVLYAAGWSAGGDPGERISVGSWEDDALPRDANQDGLLSEDELPGHPFQQRFSQVDRDKSTKVTRTEWEYYRGLFDKSRNVVLAIRPGGSGDVTSSHVAWEHSRHVPFCASPLAYRGLVFTVKDGGILTCLDARTGAPHKVGRLPTTGEYYSSPVAGDGKVYLLNAAGKLAVVSAEPQWRVLHTADFGEAVYATPALLDGRIYLRTTGHLYCFQ